MKLRFATLSILLLSSTLVLASSSWLSKVPKADRARVNPYAGNAEAAAAGKLIFEDNCAKCHGDDAEGRHGRPSLRSERVAHATDGELAWILRNGQAFHGMPSWSSLPEQQRWQIITYLRTLLTDR
ncbi:MAG: cytochrome c [Acidobacteriota bacterium]|nr:cytochrome c [Acidobacteriota bacterium]